MRKLTIKNLIDFRAKTTVGKKGFLNRHQNEAQNILTKGGGDYWITSLSAVSNSFKYDDLEFIRTKITELEEKLENTSAQRTKTMYQRNIDILDNFERYNFSQLLPNEEVSFLKKTRADFLLTINGLDIQADPQHIFSFDKNENEHIGAVWFVSTLKGYSTEEMGLFAELLFRCLNTKYGEQYKIEADQCIVIEVNFERLVRYGQITNGEIPSILNETLAEINSLR